jgi:hypothetical protein
VWTTEDREAAAAAMVEADRVEEKLRTLIGRIGSYFSRVEPVRQVRKFIHGLMSDLPRKNCGPWPNTPATPPRTGCSGCWNAHRGTTSR